ncbi:hypothetical protein [Pseudomonas sp.]
MNPLWDNCLDFDDWVWLAPTGFVIDMNPLWGNCLDFDDWVCLVPQVL